MTNDELRVVLAKWAGWTSKLVPSTPDGPDNPYGEFQHTWWRNPKDTRELWIPRELPNYPESLDAVTTLEARLTDEQYGDFLAHLHCIVHQVQALYVPVRGSVLTFEQMRPLKSATAEQHCRALVAALNLSL